MGYRRLVSAHLTIFWRNPDKAACTQCVQLCQDCMVIWLTIILALLYQVEAQIPGKSIEPSLDLLIQKQQSFGISKNSHAAINR